VYSVKNDIIIRPSWTKKGMAGADCFSNFLKRHKGLSLRQPESMSSARMTGFNKENAKQIYDRGSEVVSIHPPGGTKIWNMGETAITTVLKLNKIVVGREDKRAEVTSAELGVLITAAAVVAAQSTFMYPLQC
jgi:hypothetical protein